MLTTETLQERLTKMNVFVALTSAKQVVGTVAGHALSSEKGHLRGMAVLPSMLGNGVSAQPLGQAEDELLSRYIEYDGAARVRDAVL